MIPPLAIKAALSVKRAGDIMAAALGVVLLSPVMACIAVAVKLDDPRSPLFFNDWVMGRGATRFRMLKFRTMVPHEIIYTVVST